MKTLVALLAIAAVVGVLGWVVALSSDDDARLAELAELRSEVESLTAERNAAMVSAGGLDEALDIARARLRAAEAERDRSGDDVVALEAQVATLRDDVRAIETERDEALATAARLDADLAAAEDRAATAADERDALAELFPIEVTDPIAVDDVIGRYRVAVREAYCAGLATCGTVPAIGMATIDSSAAGHLRLSLPGLAEAGLFRIEGGLQAIAGSTTVVPACDGRARAATVSATIYPRVVEVDDDGGVEATSLAAGLTVQAPAVDGCPAVVAAYGAVLTPTT